MEAVGEEIRLPHPSFDLIVEDAVGAVALLHDLGHPPFSHVLEPAFDELGRQWVQDERRAKWIASGGAFHEFAGMVLLDQMLEDLSGVLETDFRELVRLIYEAKPSDADWKGALHSIVAGEIDVDRLDYLMRDAQKAGTEFGAIDYERLVDALELHITDRGGFRIAPSIRARSAVETLLIQRTQSYRWITYHARVVGANLALCRAFELLMSFGEDNARSVDIAGCGPTALRDLFRPLIPPLNYLAPGGLELRTIQAFVPGWRLDAAVETEVLREDGLARVLQSAVDDPVVLTALEQGGILASLLLASAQPPGDVAGDLRRYVAYTESIFARRKNVVSVWKTVDDLERAATGELFQPRLHETIDQVFDSAIEELRRVDLLSDLRRRALEHERGLHHRRLDDQPVAELNDIFSALLGDGDPNQRRLCELLRQARTPFGPKSGFWDLAFARFRAVEEREEKLSILFQRHAEKGLLKSSPLVRSLKDVADTRIRLFVFFFVTERDLQAWRADSLGLTREALVAAFLPTFLDFLREAWPAYLKLARTPTAPAPG